MRNHIIGKKYEGDFMTTKQHEAEGQKLIGETGSLGAEVEFEKFKWSDVASFFVMSLLTWLFAIL